MHGHRQRVSASNGVTDLLSSVTSIKLNKTIRETLGLRIFVNSLLYSICHLIE